MEPLALIASQRVLVGKRRRHESVMLVSVKHVSLERAWSSSCLNLQGRFMSGALVILVLLYWLQSNPVNYI